MTACPSRAQLDRLLAERLPEEEEDELASHLESCPVCQQILEELTAAPMLGNSQATLFAAGASNSTAVETPRRTTRRIRWTWTFAVICKNNWRPRPCRNITRHWPGSEYPPVGRWRLNCQ